MTTNHADRIAKAEEDTTEYVTQHDEVAVTIEADTYSTDDVRNLVEAVTKDADTVNHPQHYTGFSNGSEVIDITERLTFNTGNAVKYLARAGRIDGRIKGNNIEDLRKARWYVQRELDRMVTEEARDT